MRSVPGAQVVSVASSQDKTLRAAVVGTASDNRGTKTGRRRYRTHFEQSIVIPNYSNCIFKYWIEKKIFL